MDEAPDALPIHSRERTSNNTPERVLRIFRMANLKHLLSEPHPAFDLAEGFRLRTAASTADQPATW